ncbi:MAG: site-specific integrase, partial [Synergistaceae bacterium]|nr:site-specific integrase [Synergistaceae bacterium]
FSIYTAARPGEIRSAEWKEIKGDVWDIPAEKMKMKRRHIVPLSKQAQEILKELKVITGKGRYLFPSPRNDGRCMSENGVRIALRSMGFSKEQIVPHGFRAMLSTIANEHGFNRDVIERQLAHVEGNAVRGAYNHAEYLSQRKDLMQWWADWLDKISG